MTRSRWIDLGLTSNSRGHSSAFAVMRYFLSCHMGINQMGGERWLNMQHVCVMYVTCLHSWQASVLRCKWGKGRSSEGWGGEAEDDLSLICMACCVFEHTWLSVNLFWSTCVCHLMTCKVIETEPLSSQWNEETSPYFKLFVRFFFLHCLFLDIFFAPIASRHKDLKIISTKSWVIKSLCLSLCYPDFCACLHCCLGCMSPLH